MDLIVFPESLKLANLIITFVHFYTYLYLDSILKSRDITLPTKVRLVKAMVFQWSCMDVRVGL